MTTLAVIGIGLATNLAYVGAALVVHRWMRRSFLHRDETFAEWLERQPEEDGGKPR